MKPVWLHSRMLVAGLCASLCGCSDPAAPNPATCTRNSTVTLTVGLGSSPWISWSPSLLVQTVELHDQLDEGRLVWAAASERNGVASPIQVAAALEPSRYELVVLCSYSEGGDWIETIIGTKLFTR